MHFIPLVCIQNSFLSEVDVVFVSKLHFSFTVTNYNKLSARYLCLFFAFKIFNPEWKKEVRGGSEISCRQLGTPLSSTDASEEPNNAPFFGCSRLSLINALTSSWSSSVICQTTGPKFLPKRFLHIVRSRASSFNWQYPLLSLRSSSSFLRLLPRLLVTSICPLSFLQ